MEVNGKKKKEETKHNKAEKPKKMQFHIRA